MWVSWGATGGSVEAPEWRKGSGWSRGPRRKAVSSELRGAGASTGLAGKKAPGDRTLTLSKQEGVAGVQWTAQGAGNSPLEQGWTPGLVEMDVAYPWESSWPVGGRMGSLCRSLCGALALSRMCMPRHALRSLAQIVPADLLKPLVPTPAGPTGCCWRSICSLSGLSSCALLCP